MTPSTQRHHRRSIRLRGYDYAHAAAYFVTICTADRACLFGEVVDDVMRLNVAGQLVEQVWGAIPSHFPQVAVDEFVVMPNHVHGVIVFDGQAPTDVGAQHAAPLPGSPNVRSGSLGAVVRSFKSAATKRINEHRGSPGAPVWQRNYYEHIARELVDTVRHNVTIDWTVKESVRAKLRVIVKRILRKYGYPPDKQEAATNTVLQQAELLSELWVGTAS